MHYYALLCEPLLYIALILLAAALALRPPRQMKSWTIVLGSLGVAFLVFFMGDVLHALGISEALPLLAAAAAPTAISMLLGIAAILHLEDG
jgi:lipopolysaccharide export system permease protein